jgi:hypothetical protein
MEIHGGYEAWPPRGILFIRDLNLLLLFDATSKNCTEREQIYLGLGPLRAHGNESASAFGAQHHLFMLFCW